MTEQEQRIALCEWRGYRTEERYKGTKFPFVLINPNGIESNRWQSLSAAWSHGIPDTNSLDVLHEMEMNLTDEQHEIFRANLLDIIDTQDDLTTIRARRYCSSTAAQRREALLRTIGLWKEAK